LGEVRLLAPVIDVRIPASIRHHHESAMTRSPTTIPSANVFAVWSRVRGGIALPLALRPAGIRRKL
jgi:hypothetical protein